MNLENHRPDEPPNTGEKPIPGARWAVGLGAALLIALGLLTTVRWVDKPAVAAEEIVQLPPDKVTPTPTPAVLAPDPGDHP